MAKLKSYYFAVKNLLKLNSSQWLKSKKKQWFVMITPFKISKHWNKPAKNIRN